MGVDAGRQIEWCPVASCLFVMGFVPCKKAAAWSAMRIPRSAGIRSCFPVGLLEIVTKLHGALRRLRSAVKQGEDGISPRVHTNRTMAIKNFAHRLQGHWKRIPLAGVHMPTCLKPLTSANMTIAIESRRGVGIAALQVSGITSSINGVSPLRQQGDRAGASRPTTPFSSDRAGPSSRLAGDPPARPSAQDRRSGPVDPGEAGPRAAA